jgi:signal transduction histidine kinase
VEWPTISATLTVIHVRAQLALPPRPGRAIRQDIELLDATAARAGGLVRQLLAFSRKQVLQPRVLDLNGVVKDAEQMLQPLIGEDVSLAIALAPGLGRVKADPIQLEQVLINLAVNARDAMPEGGELAVETADVELDGAFAFEPRSSRGAHVVLRVRTRAPAWTRRRGRRSSNRSSRRKRSARGRDSDWRPCTGS